MMDRDIEVSYLIDTINRPNMYVDFGVGQDDIDRVRFQPPSTAGGASKVSLLNSAVQGTTFSVDATGTVVYTAVPPYNTMNTGREDQIKSECRIMGRRILIDDIPLVVFLGPNNTFAALWGSTTPYIQLCDGTGAAWNLVPNGTGTGLTATAITGVTMAGQVGDPNWHRLTGRTIFGRMDRPNVLLGSMRIANQFGLVELNWKANGQTYIKMQGANGTNYLVAPDNTGALTAVVAP